MGVAVCRGGRRDPEDYATALQQLAQRATASCFEERPESRGGVWLELTLHEIVDLEVEPTGDDALDRCLTERLWGLALPRFFKLPRLSASVELGGSA